MTSPPTLIPELPLTRIYLHHRLGFTFTIYSVTTYSATPALKPWTSSITRLEGLTWLREDNEVD